jgi:hypothetical protein
VAGGAFSIEGCDAAGEGGDVTARLIDSFVTIACAKEGCGLVFQVHVSDLGKLESAFCSSCERDEAITEQDRSERPTLNEANYMAPKWWR